MVWPKQIPCTLHTVPYGFSCTGISCRAWAPKTLFQVEAQWLNRDILLTHHPLHLMGTLYHGEGLMTTSLSARGPQTSTPHLVLRGSCPGTGMTGEDSGPQPPAGDSGYPRAGREVAPRPAEREGSAGGEWPCRASPINSPRRGGGGRSPRSRRRRSCRRRRSGRGHSQHRGQRPRWAPSAAPSWRRRRTCRAWRSRPPSSSRSGTTTTPTVTPFPFPGWWGEAGGGMRGGGCGSHNSLAAIPQPARPHGWGSGRARSAGAAPPGEHGLETSLAALKSGESLEGAVTPGITLFIVGNGYMDGKELQNFIQELQQARKKAGLVG